MKNRRNSLLWLASAVVLGTALACGSGSAPRQTPTAGPVGPAEAAPATQAVMLTNTEAPQPTTPPPPPPAAKSKLHWGTYMCLNQCIAEEFLEDYPVVGGVPPLRWLDSQMTVRVSQDGSITSGGAFFWILTNPDGGEACTSGEYQFAEETTTGSYDEAANILSVEITGEERYSALGGGEDCAGADIVQQATKQFILAVDGQGSLVLCKAGETGQACLDHPMAVLKQ